METAITINLRSGDFTEGFDPVIVAIWSLGSGEKSPANLTFQLPPFSQMPMLYENWQKQYRGLVAPDTSSDTSRSGFKKGQPTHISISEEIVQRVANCDRSARELQQGLNQWLQPVKEGLEPTLRSNTAKRICCEISDAGNCRR